MSIQQPQHTHTPRRSSCSLSSVAAFCHSNSPGGSPKMKIRRGLERCLSEVAFGAPPNINVFHMISPHGNLLWKLPRFPCMRYFPLPIKPLYSNETKFGWIIIPLDKSIPLYNVGHPSYACWFINSMKTIAIRRYHKPYLLKLFDPT